MWIKQKRFEALEKKVAALEESQLHANTMVKEYIQDQESLSNVLSEEIRSLPTIVASILNDYCSNK